MKQAASWSLVWVTLSLLFNAAFWWYLVQTQGRAVADHRRWPSSPAI
ncbi:Inner membrane protein alx [Kluyvera cryocrescens]|uniref:Inner membrane protein alx n=1 Tax=Kluyvera cryocrescens TaxID=580 RepID=A0A485AFC3_KLUCR|nr:Inner membrane protein alx [Kluyvera cryocrescens]